MFTTARSEWGLQNAYFDITYKKNIKDIHIEKTKKDENTQFLKICYQQIKTSKQDYTFSDLISLFLSHFLSPILTNVWHEGAASPYSPSRAETPTKLKSRCLQEQPPVWSTRELQCAVLLHFLETLSLSPVIKHQNEGKPRGQVS